jgi:hypothetical protein
MFAKCLENGGKMVERKGAKRSVVLLSRQRWTLRPQGGELSAGIRLV